MALAFRSLSTSSSTASTCINIGLLARWITACYAQWPRWRSIEADHRAIGLLQDFSRLGSSRPTSLEDRCECLPLLRVVQRVWWLHDIVLPHEVDDRLQLESTGIIDGFNYPATERKGFGGGSSTRGHLDDQIIALKNREPTESINLNTETEGSSSNRSENSSEIKLDISTRTPPAMDSPSSNHHHGHPIIPTNSSRPLFLPSIITRPTSAAVAHLFPNSSSSSRQPDHKIIDHQNAVKEESFSNMFCAIDDQSGFWPWLEQQHFN
ncbi:hypothetical protein HYC85_003222 [Camellia sinensis]|uniref:Uncharacterized protein n=1 Tax=Camellia sinensis TaxID=4442 RepID=A0A7J7IAP7_CAMSI|nr:hypothetical protein HYC85_003222 [Camellia sinensis]